jgi:alkaline phosphatase D
MDRRESLKLMLLAAVTPSRLLAADATPPAGPSFASDWRSWPRMRWVGPGFWGNRLQDWRLQDGIVTCDVAAPNRTLHCLTHRATSPEFTTAVTIDPSVLMGTTNPSACIGLRIGIVGRNSDPRSAAVHGTGLDVGLTAPGVLRIGELIHDVVVPMTKPLRLEFRSRVTPTGIRVEASLHSRQGAPSLAGFVVEGWSPDRVLGNLALLSHFDSSTDGPGASFADWTIEGPGIVEDPGAAYGPIMFAQYTVHRGVLKLTAQLAPVDEIPGALVILELAEPNEGWRPVGEAAIDPLARTARFRVERWDPSRAASYRVRLNLPLAGEARAFEYHGTIAAAPPTFSRVKAAVFSCNADHGFPDAEVVTHVTHHEPDLALFLGDQFYEGSGGFGIQTDTVETAALDMLHKWFMFGWSYREIFRHIPSACIPDDHDVYHGNIWGEGGHAAPLDRGWGAPAQDRGGYKMPPAWVNAVQLAQTSHLPDPPDPRPVDQGIGVYFTDWEYGGVSFAILEDRKFKSAPANVLPAEAQVFNGWIQNPEFDIRDHRDPAGATLLGDRQLAFLATWARDWRGPTHMKVVLSQTNFAAVHTIPHDATSGAVLPGLPVPPPGEYVEGDKLAVDMDSNGWPQARRDDVLRLIRRCAAFHIAGDQHLATMVRHGIDHFGDAGFSFTGPALNNIWPRRWWPAPDVREAPLTSDGPAYTGDYFDGFGNRITVHAAASPTDTGLEPAIVRNRATGYGIVTFDSTAGRIRIECWPRHVDPAAQPDGQFPGWPIEIDRESGDGRRPLGHLPRVEVSGLTDPVVELLRIDRTLVSSRRIIGQRVMLPYFERAPHVVRVGSPEEDRWLERRVEPDATAVLEFIFP